jgi:hypothetical protein
LTTYTSRSSPSPSLSSSVPITLSLCGMTVVFGSASSAIQSTIFLSTLSAPASQSALISGSGVRSSSLSTNFQASTSRGIQLTSAVQSTTTFDSGGNLLLISLNLGIIIECSITFTISSTVTSAISLTSAQTPFHQSERVRQR